MFFLFLMSIFLIYNPQSLKSYQESEFIPFNLQACENQLLTLFLSETDEQITLEVQLTLVNSSFYLNYFEPLGNQKFNKKSIELNSGDYFNRTIITNNVYLILVNNSNFFANYTAEGSYRVHDDLYKYDRSWKPFNLTICKPTSINIFKTEGDEVNNISVDLEIERINNGVLEIYFHYPFYETVNNPGIYHFNNLTHQVNLTLRSENFSHVVGSYLVTDFGRLINTSMNGFSWSFMIGTSIVVLFKKKLLRFN